MSLHTPHEWPTLGFPAAGCHGDSLPSTLVNGWKVPALDPGKPGFDTGLRAEGPFRCL